MEHGTEKNDGRSGKYFVLALLFSTVSLSYVSCTYNMRPRFVGMLPSEFKAQWTYAVYSDGDCPSSVAVFEIPEEVKKEISEDENRFFGQTMSPRMQGSYEAHYNPWSRTPVPPNWQSTESVKGVWGGFECASRHALVRTIMEAGWHEGGYYTAANGGWKMVALPRLGYVVLSHSSF